MLGLGRCLLLRLRLCFPAHAPAPDRTGGRTPGSTFTGIIVGDLADQGARSRPAHGATGTSTLAGLLRRLLLGLRLLLVHFFLLR